MMPKQKHFNVISVITQHYKKAFLEAANIYLLVLAH